MDNPEAAEQIAASVLLKGAPIIRTCEALLLLCIGTDRSIGDSLGPLVGSFLRDKGELPFHVMGTLDQPVHATNLQDTIDQIDGEYRRPFILALDACLGRPESVGMITVASGALKPGAGVNKTLPAVGQLHVTGIVNVGGFMEYFVLQNTRLSLVMRMARIVADGLWLGMDRLSAAWQQTRCSR